MQTWVITRSVIPPDCRRPSSNRLYWQQRTAGTFPKTREWSPKSGDVCVKFCKFEQTTSFSMQPKKKIGSVCFISEDIATGLVLEEVGSGMKINKDWGWLPYKKGCAYSRSAIFITEPIGFLYPKFIDSLRPCRPISSWPAARSETTEIVPPTTTLDDYAYQTCNFYQVSDKGRSWQATTTFRGLRMGFI